MVDGEEHRVDERRHAPRREILGSKYPRKYTSSTMGLATPLTTNLKTHVITNAAVEYLAKSSARNNTLGNQK